jgi:hypothetical protein
MIPKIIHQTWKSKSDLPDNFRYWSDTFKKLNPDFDYRIYDDVDNQNLIKKYSPRLLEIYDSYSLEIYRVDIARIMYLIIYGGFYLDMDFQCLNSLEKYCSYDDMVLCQMGTNSNFEHSIPNAIIFSPKGHPFLYFYLYQIIERQKEILKSGGSEEAPEFATGPVMLKKSLHKYQSSNWAESLDDFIGTNFPKAVNRCVGFKPILIESGYKLLPIDWNDSIHQSFRQKLLLNNRLLTQEEAKKMFPNSDVVTYWTHTWPGKDFGKDTFGVIDK